MSWYKNIIHSIESTTRYLMDNDPDVAFRVISQEEKDGKIIRISLFLKDQKIIVHSSVEMNVDKNPVEFIEAIRYQNKPIGELIAQYNYSVERKITAHGTSFKEYEMVGDLYIKIKEVYYDIEPSVA